MAFCSSTITEMHSSMSLEVLIEMYANFKLYLNRGDYMK